MKIDAKWYLLAILLLILLTIVAPQMISLRAYTTQQMRDICFDVYDQCLQLEQQKGGGQQWAELEQEAIPRLLDVADEIERLPSDRSLDAWKLYQMARHDLPGIIKERRIGSRRDRIEQTLLIAAGAADQNHLAEPSRAAASGDSDSWIPNWDPLMVGVLIMDGLIIGYWWRFRRTLFKRRQSAV